MFCFKYLFQFNTLHFDFFFPVTGLGQIFRNLNYVHNIINYFCVDYILCASLLDNMSSAPLPDDMSSAPLPDDVSSTPLPDDISSAPLLVFDLICLFWVNSVYLLCCFSRKFFSILSLIFG